MEKLTENFVKEEFQCNCGCGLMFINPAIVQRLQVVRDIVGLPINILSGCRCKKHNIAIYERLITEGKTIRIADSQHLYGNAVDWTVEEYSMKHIALKLHEWSGGFKFYPGDNFIHTDVGPKRRW